MGRRGLIDSNVLVAAATVEHRHYQASQRLLNESVGQDFVIATHCLSEFYSNASRPLTQGGAQLDPVQVDIALIAHVANLEVLGLSVSQHIAALRRFAALGGKGPLVYDFIIGTVAVVHAIPAIVTWNVRHFAPLFPTLRVVTPSEYLQEP